MPRRYVLSNGDSLVRSRSKRFPRHVLLRTRVVLTFEVVCPLWASCWGRERVRQRECVCVLARVWVGGWVCTCLSEREKARGRYRWGKIIEANCEHISVLLFFSFSGEGAFSCFMTIAKTTTTAAATTKLFGQKFFFCLEKMLNFHREKLNR